MPNDTSSATTAVAVESPDGAAVSVGRERRVTEQLISDWQEETRRLGHALAFMTLNTSAMTGPKWAHRFIIIAVNPMVEHSSLLFYGAGFASLLGLPPEPDKSVPISAQLPARSCPCSRAAVSPRRCPVGLSGGRARSSVTMEDRSSTAQRSSA